MSQNTKMLVVDDETNFLELVEAAFEDIYDVITTPTSNGCLSLLEENEFDLILLDINIDDRNGFELCEHIQEHYSNSAVVFISGLSTQEDIVQGYQVGAVDYIVKPIRLRELTEKITSIVAIRKKLKEFEVRSSDAQQVAFSAMADSSQLGRILEFMDNNVNCPDIDAVGTSLLETCESIGLIATIYIETPNEKCQQATGGAVQHIETLLIEQVRHQGRIIDFNKRTLYNDKHVTLLIKNMPLDDPIEYGRLKDSLATLVCGANSRINSIMNEQLLEDSRDAIAKALISIEDRIQRQTDLTTNLMKEFMTDMESALLVLGLSEDQENYVLSLVDTHLTSVVEVVTSANETQSTLRSSLNSLQ